MRFSRIMLKNRVVVEPDLRRLPLDALLRLAIGCARSSASMHDAASGTGTEATPVREFRALARFALFSNGWPGQSLLGIGWY